MPGLPRRFKRARSKRANATAATRPCHPWCHRLPPLLPLLRLRPLLLLLRMSLSQPLFWLCLLLNQQRKA